MALGYCLVCDKLVPIKQGEYKFAGSRERAWRPWPHDNADGKQCPGEKKAI